MESKKMNAVDFDRIWDEAEAAAQGRRMAAEYPGWLRRRRRNGGLAMMAVVLMVAAVPMLTMRSDVRGYDRVVCNRDGMSDAQWADLAAEMLTIG